VTTEKRIARDPTRARRHAAPARAAERVFRLSPSTRPEATGDVRGRRADERRVVHGAAREER
jgi:hypothetical protein